MTERLDIRCARELGESRARAAAMIAEGLVRVNGKTIQKASHPVSETDIIEADAGCPYVSRGGVKLAHALDCFAIDLTGAICVDIGASTGGFTDCMLKRGAKSVLAVDVGKGQLHEKLLSDRRVTSLESTNIADLSATDMPVGLIFAAADVSFVSLTKLAPAIADILPANVTALFLVKPQFELTRKQISKSGIVKDPKDREKAVKSVKIALAAAGFDIKGMVKSPITGGDGNVEYFLFATRCVLRH